MIKAITEHRGHAVDAPLYQRRRTLVWLSTAAFLLLSSRPGSALAQDNGQAAQRFFEVQQRARELVEAGRVRPLREIVKMLRDHVDGEIIDVELLEIGSGYFYRFKVLTHDGRVDELFVDAKTPEILTLPQARQRFPKEIAELESKQKSSDADPLGPKLNLADLPPRLRSVMQELQKRVDGKIVDFDFRRVANSLIFVFDLRTDKGQTERFFVHARTGEIRTPEQARDFISQRFPWLMDELYPPAARPK
ncbi:MAG: PepSY domain-containing protein [Rhodomicrobiaceae bacterium]